MMQVSRVSFSFTSAPLSCLSILPAFLVSLAAVMRAAPFSLYVGRQIHLHVYVSYGCGACGKYLGRLHVHILYSAGAQVKHVQLSARVCPGVCDNQHRLGMYVRVYIKRGVYTRARVYIFVCLCMWLCWGFFPYSDACLVDEDKSCSCLAVARSV